MTTITTAPAASASPADLLRTLARRWCRHTARLSDRYRPERHYMRGPGPKWREKNGLSAGALQ